MKECKPSLAVVKLTDEEHLGNEIHPRLRYIYLQQKISSANNHHTTRCIKINVNWLKLNQQHKQKCHNKLTASNNLFKPQIAEKIFKIINGNNYNSIHHVCNFVH